MKYQDYLIESDSQDSFFETSACIGVICPDTVGKKCRDIISDPKNAKAEVIKETFEKVKGIVGGGGYDWESKGVSQIQKLSVTKNLDKVILVFSLISGMYAFRKEQVEGEISGALKFIHKSIQKYYEVEVEVLGSIKGSKKNTTDVVISNVGPDQIFKAMRQGPISIDDSSSYIFFGNNVRAFQCSLKKGSDSAQIGKITSFVRKNLELGVSPTQAKVDIMNAGHYFDLLDKVIITEGIWDKAKKFAKKLWDGVSSAIKKVMSGFISKWIGVFKGTPPRAYLVDFFTGMGNQKLQEAMTAITAKQVEELSGSKKKAISLINNEIKRLKNNVHGDKTIYINATTMTPTDKFKGETKKGVFTLVSNYCAVRALIDMVSDQKTTGATVNRLVAEMLFGNTNLPVWKIFGDAGDGNEYMYLGTIQTFVTGGKVKSDVEILGIRISPFKNKDYYVIMVAMLEHMDEEGKTYVLLRTGTNTASRFSFILEGIKRSDPIPLDQSVATFVNKKK